MRGSRRFRLGLALSFLLATTATAWAQSPTTLRVIRSAAVLEEPDADAAVLGTVIPSEILEVLDERESWYLVRPSDQNAQREWRTGWIARALVEPLDSGGAPDRPVLLPVDASTEVTSGSLDRIRERLSTTRPVADVKLDAAIQTASCDVSRATGRDDGESGHGTAGWFLGGVGAGIGLGLIGTGVITGASALAGPQPQDIPSDMQESCYREGYRGKAKSKNVVSALLGGVTGTAVWLVIYLIATD